MRTGFEPLTITLRDVCFCHWPVSEAHVSRLIPGWLTPDTADGSAWISALTMEMARFDAFGVPLREDVLGVNLRTYVTSPGGDRGVYVCSLDATDELAVETARRFLDLPYYYADVDLRTHSDGRTVRATRRDDARPVFELSYSESGPTQTASPDTLASFLTERYRYFTEGPLGTRLVGSVGHEPWPLQSANASITEDELLATVGLEDPEDRPLAHYSAGRKLRIGPPRPLSARE